MNQDRLIAKGCHSGPKDRPKRPFAVEVLVKVDVPVNNGAGDGAPHKARDATRYGDAMDIKPPRDLAFDELAVARCGDDDQFGKVGSFGHGLSLHSAIAKRVTLTRGFWSNAPSP